MDVQLKPLDQQVIVVTGASSGIGLATARAAVARGAKVVLASRSIDTLDDVVRELNAGSGAGGEAIFVPCDVGKREDVEAVAAEAVKRFGRIDTWVNNAGVSIYGKLEDVGEEDFRKLFDTNFWGVVHGSLIALKHLRTGGGALINIGSEVSEAVVPLQGMYSASKHAVKGFTDALRVEVEEVDKLPVSITLIQPTATDTPFPQNARNYMAKEPKLPDPLDKPENVADAILDAAVTPTRSTKVGAMSKVNTFVAKVAPGIGDKIAAKQVHRQQYDERPRDPHGALYKPSETGGQVHGSGGVKSK
jgi:NAD(P)-dependent dehydrogenase (short-subunit alcohol dehydrogenase family)